MRMPRAAGFVLSGLLIATGVLISACRDTLIASVGLSDDVAHVLPRCSDFALGALLLSALVVWSARAQQPAA